MLATGIHIVRLWIWHVRPAIRFDARGLSGDPGLDVSTVGRLLWGSGSRSSTVVRRSLSRRYITPK